MRLTGTQQRPSPLSPAQECIRYSSRERGFCVLDQETHWGRRGANVTKGPEELAGGICTAPPCASVRYPGMGCRCCCVGLCRKFCTSYDGTSEYRCVSALGYFTRPRPGVRLLLWGCGDLLPISDTPPPLRWWWGCCRRWGRRSSGTPSGSRYGDRGRGKDTICKARGSRDVFSCDDSAEWTG